MQGGVLPCSGCLDIHSIHCMHLFESASVLLHAALWQLGRSAEPGHMLPQLAAHTRQQQSRQAREGGQYASSNASCCWLGVDSQQGRTHDQ